MLIKERRCKYTLEGFLQVSQRIGKWTVKRWEWKLGLVGLVNLDQTEARRFITSIFKHIIIWENISWDKAIPIARGGITKTQLNVHDISSKWKTPTRIGAWEVCNSGQIENYKLQLGPSRRTPVILPLAMTRYLRQDKKEHLVLRALYRNLQLAGACFI